MPVSAWCRAVDQKKPGWQAEPLLTGSGDVPEVFLCVSSAIAIDGKLVIGGSSMTLPWCFMDVCGLPSNTNRDAGSGGSKYRRRAVAFRRVPSWSLALVLCPDGRRVAEAEATQAKPH